jgi:hypothetical protein
MHLIEPLVVGIRGAESGSVDFYRRGTSTRIIYYETFEGDGGTTPIGSVALDENGGGVFYVNETAMVVVKDATGTEVRRFVASPNASAVEVISSSFTGTDYETGQTGLSEPTTLKAIFDLWTTNAGAPDFKVLVGGVATTLQSALGAIGSLFFSVKDIAYGATGDGTTNDSAAIQGAIDAAEAAGGGIVFFPKGTYRHNSTLTIPAGVSLLGAGPGASRLMMGSVNTSLEFEVSTQWQTVEGLRIDTSAGHSAVLIKIETGNLVVFRNCVIGDTAMTSSAVRFNDSDTVVWFYNCVFKCGSTTGSWLLDTGGVSHVVLVGCELILPATAGGTLASLSAGGFLFCKFNTSGMSAGTATLCTLGPNDLGAGNVAFIIGCIGKNPAGGTLTYRAGSAASASRRGLLDIGNVWGTSVVQPSGSSSPSAATYFEELSLRRERGRYYVASDDAAISVSADQYATAQVVRTNNGVQTVTLDTPGAPNRFFTLSYHNNHGAGGGTITMGGDVKGLTTFTVNASSVSHYTFVSVHVGTASDWVLVGSSVNQTP